MKLDCMDEELRQIHEASMQILERTGVKFHHPEVVELLRQKGIKVCGQNAFISREQISEWVCKAPATFTLYARNPRYDMVVGGDNVECGPGGGASVILGSDGTTRPAMMTDYINFLKLYQQADIYKINGCPVVQPADISSQNSVCLLLYANILYSDKGIATGTGPVEVVQEGMDMLGILFGKDELVKKPRIIAVTNTSTPLQYDKNTLETIMVFVKHAQPVVIAACSMAGTTAPVTLAGTIALTNAEVLAGIAVTQMLKEGTPVVYGSQSTTSDMKTGCIAIGSPEGALCYEYAARLAKAYRLPCRGGGALTDAKSLSVQAGYESMLTYLVTQQAGMNLIFQSSGVMDGYASMSYEKFIIDLEIIKIAKRYRDGCKVNNNIPETSLSGTVLGDPSDKLFENITNKKNAMLESYQKPELSQAIHQQLVDYLVKKGFDEQYIEFLQQM
ncbi:trimethylamine methyltransferase family protein [Sporomusa malonica]|uniref:Trimethylamine---corrinoid protein Co-methyltransferase n=1 Tax=Sporomusa malonica TaxID=112901 RepID=A0A1W2EQ60_9FIRM|nr:trimethylamine methyltransferase family protein [Sporomusa malonica]SMD11815.1 trimethylamine---corrinoid protein Co-methyltransferase [Sporomusa malonica]